MSKLRWGLVFVIFLIVVGLITNFRKLYNQSVLQRPGFPQEGSGYPTVQLNQGADSIRRLAIKTLGYALKSYYASYGKPPESLGDLVSNGLLRKVPVDPLTKQEPHYYPVDVDHGCRVEFQLSDGSFVREFCK